MKKQFKEYGELALRVLIIAFVLCGGFIILMAARKGGNHG